MLILMKGSKDSNALLVMIIAKNRIMTEMIIIIRMIITVNYKKIYNDNEERERENNRCCSNNDGINADIVHDNYDYDDNYCGSDIDYNYYCYNHYWMSVLLHLSAVIVHILTTFITATKILMILIMVIKMIIVTVIITDGNDNNNANETSYM